MTLSSAARHVAAAAAAGTMLIALVSPASAQTFAGHLAVRLYDFSALDTSIRAAALDEARAILADAGVSASWHDCYRTEGCAPEPGELVVRVVRETGEHGVAWQRALGFSVIDPAAGSGTLATIFINRVEDSSRHAGSDLALLLGRAIAHEVGHLILRTNAHAGEGLMRAIWTEQELARNMHDDWVFASSDRRQIRAVLQRTGTSAAR
jgi:hypothetical protein